MALKFILEAVATHRPNSPQPDRPTATIPPHIAAALSRGADPVVKILIASWGSYGDVYPYVGLALALKARGHEPRLAMADFYRPLVESLGFPFHAIGPQIDPENHALVARLIDPIKGPEALVAGLVVPAVRQDYDALAAAADDVDVMVTHPLTFAAPLVAQARRIPWASTVLAPMSFFSASDPPVLALAPALIHVRHLGSWYGKVLGRIARAQTRVWVRPIDELRRDVGLPAGDHPLFEGQFSPYLTLALFSRVFATPQPDWPPHVEMTGFVFYNGPEMLDPQVDAFLADGPPPVVFTLGTSAVHAAGTFYEESVQAAVRLGLRAVLLTGGIAQNRPKAVTSKDVLVVDRAPHQLLFPRAAVVVHQGGAGTTGQALRSGRPMLVVPHAHDQPDNAFRARRLGVARTVQPARYRAGRVSRDLDALLRDGGYAARAEEIAAIVRAEGGAAAAAAAIEARFRANLSPGNANGSTGRTPPGGLGRGASKKEKLDG
jgi:UDP:flavonoid glycosyltransferase YjiC (YdhE family)